MGPAGALPRPLCVAAPPPLGKDQEKNTSHAHRTEKKGDLDRMRTAHKEKGKGQPADKRTQRLQGVHIPGALPARLFVRCHEPTAIRERDPVAQSQGREQDPRDAPDLQVAHSLPWRYPQNVPVRPDREKRQGQQQRKGGQDRRKGAERIFGPVRPPAGQAAAHGFEEQPAAEHDSDGKFVSLKGQKKFPEDQDLGNDEGDPHHDHGKGLCDAVHAGPPRTRRSEENYGRHGRQTTS